MAQSGLAKQSIFSNKQNGNLLRNGQPQIIPTIQPTTRTTVNPILKNLLRGKDDETIILVINDEWFQMNNNDSVNWSPGLTELVLTAIEERDGPSYSPPIKLRDGRINRGSTNLSPLNLSVSSGTDTGSSAGSGFAGSQISNAFWPPPPLFVHLNSCVLNFDGDASCSQSSQIRSGANGQQKHQYCWFNDALYQLMALSKVSFDQLATFDQWRCYSETLMTSKLHFNKKPMLSRMQALMYPSDISKVTSFFIEHSKHLFERGKITQADLTHSLDEIIHSSMPYFGARFELMKQITEINNTMSQSIGKMLQTTFMNSLKRLMPHCATKAQRYAQQVFQTLQNEADDLKNGRNGKTQQNRGRRDAQKQPQISAEEMYSTLFQSLLTETCLANPPSKN